MKRKVVEIYFEDENIMPTFVLDDGSVKYPYRRGERLFWLTRQEVDQLRKQNTEKRQSTGVFNEILWMLGYRK